MNKLELDVPSLVYGYEGMDGLKTGTTDFAGYCFTGTAKRDGKDLSLLFKMQQMEMERWL